MFDIKVTTTIHQTDCGPTCLKMLLDYYGIDSDMESLRSECNVSIAGCSMADLKRTGEKYGLDIKAYLMDAEELAMQDRPAIVSWTHNHFIVFGGVDDFGKVIIVDPDRGRTRMPVYDLKKLYTGYAIFNGEPESMPMNTVQDIAEVAYINAEYNAVLLDMMMEVI